MGCVSVLHRPEDPLSRCTSPLSPLLAPVFLSAQTLAAVLSPNIVSISFLCSVTLTCSLWCLPSPSLVSEAIHSHSHTLSTTLPASLTLIDAALLYHMFINTRLSALCFLLPLSLTHSCKQCIEMSADCSCSPCGK